MTFSKRNEQITEKIFNFKQPIIDYVGCETKAKIWLTIHYSILSKVNKEFYDTVASVVKKGVEYEYLC